MFSWLDAELSALTAIVLSGSAANDDEGTIGTNDTTSAILKTTRKAISEMRVLFFTETTSNRRKMLHQTCADSMGGSIQDSPLVWSSARWRFCRCSHLCNASIRRNRRRRYTLAPLFMRKQKSAHWRTTCASVASWTANERIAFMVVGFLALREGSLRMSSIARSVITAKCYAFERNAERKADYGVMRRRFIALRKAVE